MVETMNMATVPMKLSGAMDLIKKSRSSPTLLYEAITNSLEAISQRSYPDGEESKRLRSCTVNSFIQDEKDEPCEAVAGMKAPLKAEPTLPIFRPYNLLGFGQFQPHSPSQRDHAVQNSL